MACIYAGGLPVPQKQDSLVATGMSSQPSSSSSGACYGYTLLERRSGLPGPSVLCSSCRHNNVEHSHCTCQCVRGAPDAGHLAEQALSCAYCYGSGAALYSRQTDDIHLNGERALPGADLQGLRAEKCHLLGQRWDPGHKPWSWCHARALATTTLHR